MPENLISGELYRVLANQTSGKMSNIEANIKLESGKKISVRKGNDPLVSISMKKIRIKNEEFSRLTQWNIHLEFVEYHLFALVFQDW